MHGIVFIGMFVTVLAAATPTLAAILAWRDAEGVTHYVDNLDNVPSEYREGVVTFVKDWERPAPPAEGVSPAPVTDTPPAATAQTIEMALASFERGFWAGRQSAMATQPAVVYPWGSIVQNVQVIAPPEVATTFPFFVGPVFPFRARLHPRHAFPRRFFRGGFIHGGFFRGRFIQGPAGPPPFGAAGPPPVVFFPHFRR